MRSASFSALGTTAVVAVTDDTALPDAHASLIARLALLDETCSRFRADSELSRANSRAGDAIEVSPLLAELLSVALRAADESDGLVVPTLGSQLRAAGYDRTYSLVRARDRWTVGEAVPASSWRVVELDVASRTLRTPPGVELDLGATAKGWAADDASGAIADATAAGVLVSLGGDVSVAGQTPDGGWPIRIAESHDAPLNGQGPVVAIAYGGLATSSTGVRTWRTDRGLAHHLLDPRTGRPTQTPWRTVTTTAPTCTAANVAAIATFLLGDAAPDWLAARELSARLVDTNGNVVGVGDWPCEAQAA